MWALLCVIAAVYWLLRAWIRSGLPWFDFVLLRFASVYARLWHRWSCNRRGKFHPVGPGIVIANHTCSADPTLIMAGCDRLFSFLVSHQHFNLHPISYGVLSYMRCIPVTRAGQDPGGLLRALKRLGEGGIVCLFPEGNLSGVALNRLRPGKPGAALLALRSGAPVYPVFIAGGPRTDRLLHSWLFPCGKAARLCIGPAIDLSRYLDQPRTRKVIEEVTTLFMSKIAELNPKLRRAENR